MIFDAGNQSSYLSLLLWTRIRLLHRQQLGLYDQDISQQTMILPSYTFGILKSRSAKTQMTMTVANTSHSLHPIRREFQSLVYQYVL